MTTSLLWNFPGPLSYLFHFRHHMCWVVGTVLLSWINWVFFYGILRYLVTYCHYCHGIFTIVLKCFWIVSNIFHVIQSLLTFKRPMKVAVAVSISVRGNTGLLFLGLVCYYKSLYKSSCSNSLNLTFVVPLLLRAVDNLLSPWPWTGLEPWQSHSWPD